MMRASFLFTGLIIALNAAVFADPPDLIPRKILFGNPDRAAVRISHDGKYLSYLAPKDGVMNVWIAPIDDLSKSHAVTTATTRGIRFYAWAFTNHHLLYAQDQAGNEDWVIHAVNIDNGEDKSLTPEKNVSARIDRVGQKFPNEILVSLNDREPQFHDLWRINILTGEKTLVAQNPGTIEGGTVAGLLSDEDYAVRMAITFTPDGGQEIFQPVTQPEKQDGTPGWESFAKIPMPDMLTTSPEFFDRSGEVLYMTDSRGRDTGILKSLNLKTGDEQILAQNDHADAGEILSDPKTLAAQAVEFETDRRTWKIIDPNFADDFKYLATVCPGDFSITSRSDDDHLWTIAYTSDTSPVRYYLYDHTKKTSQFLFENRHDLANKPLAAMRCLSIKSHDNLDLTCYLTLPPNISVDANFKPDHPLPLVLLVHGGPWERDSWGFNPLHQWLANRGYAVLSVNFRGSTGFGKTFVNAADGEWGGKMSDDLLDAVQAMITANVADATKIAVMGGGYGGYATLAGLSFSPKTFACGVDICGPSDLNTVLQTIPPYWQPAASMWKTRVGDWTTDAGRALLAQRSPLTRAGDIDKPLLIGQGANDPRVRQGESDQIVAAMKSKNIPVTYVVYPDEGSGFARPENRLGFFALTEAFLAEHLGGRAEPIGDAVSGSSAKILAGADQIPAK